jgi:hypothetical protein
MLVATAWPLDLTNALNAIGLADALLGVLGLVLSALTAVAGALVVADVRADVDAARAWQRISAAVTVVGTPVEMAPASRIDARYFVGPQDEGLQRILQAHRFVVPPPAPSDVIQPAPARIDAIIVGGLDDAPADKGLLTSNALVVADTLSGGQTEPAVAAISRMPRLIATNAIVIGGGGQRCALRTAPRTRLVANAGICWDWPVRCAGDPLRGPAGSIAADVIVLADRNGRDHDRAPPNFAPEAATPAQPSCRGPPIGGSQRQAHAELTPASCATDKRHRSGAEPPTAPADLAVIDNLGDRIPVGAAEVEAVEAYLDDVLRELLAAVCSGQDGHTS